MKKLLAVIAAAAVALTLVGCKMGDMIPGATEQGTKYNLTVSTSNDGSSGKLYQRGWKQLGNKETVQAIETTITIDMTKASGKAKQVNGKWVEDDAGNQNTGVVIGLIFDLHETKKKETNAQGKEVTNKYYDFCLVGYQPAGKKYYIERYTDVPEKAFAEATDSGTWCDEDKTTYITKKTDYAAGSGGYIVPSNTSFVEETTGKMPKDDDGNEGSGNVNLQKITVSVTQETKGTYKITIGDKTYSYAPTDTNMKDGKDTWKNKDGYRIGGAGYYINCPVGLTAKANFNSNKQKTIGLLVDEE